MSNYLIGSFIRSEFYNNNAILLEVEFVDGPDFLIQVGKSFRESLTIITSNPKNNFKPYENLKSYKKIRFFKIKKMVCKMTDGTDHLKGKAYKEHYDSESEKFAIERPSRETKCLHFRKKMSIENLEFLNSIDDDDVFCCPDDFTNLIFSAKDDQSAIDYFKEIVPNLYFGCLNENITFNTFEEDSYFDEIFSGKSNYMGHEKKIDIPKCDPNDYRFNSIFTEINGKRYFDLSKYSLSNFYNIENDFYSKLNLYAYISNKNLDFFKELELVLKKYIKDFSGFLINRVFILKDYQNCPLPVFNLKTCFDKLRKNSCLDKDLFLIQNNIEEFLIKRNYFIIKLDEFDFDALRSGKKFLSKNVELMPLNKNKKKALVKILESKEEK